MSQLILELSNLDFLAWSLRTLLCPMVYQRAQSCTVLWCSNHGSIPNFHFGTACASLFPVLKKDIYLFVEILRLENA